MLKHHPRMRVLALLALLVGCDRDPAGPIALVPMYELESADGQAVPVNAFRTVSNEAGTCVYDLLSGVLTLSETANYGLSFTYDMWCAGSSTPTRVHDQSNGTFTRAGDDLTLTPRAHGTFTIEGVRLQVDAAIVDIRMNAGEEYRFRFVGRSQVNDGAQPFAALAVSSRGVA